MIQRVMWVLLFLASACAGAPKLQLDVRSTEEPPSIVFRLSDAKGGVVRALSLDVLDLGFRSVSVANFSDVPNFGYVWSVAATPRVVGQGESELRAREVPAVFCYGEVPDGFVLGVSPKTLDPRRSYAIALSNPPYRYFWILRVLQGGNAKVEGPVVIGYY